MVAPSNHLATPETPAYTATALILHPDTSFERWEEIGGVLRGMEKSLMWWIGDWCNFGERKFGETYSQALEVSGYAYDTVRKAAWVSGRIELCRRRHNLSWSHHHEAASLATQEEADELLDRAEAEKLSTRELRQEVRVLKGVSESPPVICEVKAMFGGLWIPVPSDGFEAGQKVKIMKVKS